MESQLQTCTYRDKKLKANCHVAEIGKHNYEETETM